MKKLLIILAILVFAPITVNASSMWVNFDNTTCQMRVFGEFEGAHQAQVVYYINNNFEGEANGSVVNNQYEVFITLAYNEDKVLKVITADENGDNEMIQDPVIIPECTPPAPTKVTELFDINGQGHSIVINDANVGFEQTDTFEIEINSKEDLDQMLASLQGNPNYDTYEAIFAKMNTVIGEGNELKFHLEPTVKDELGARIDYNGYNDGFVLNLLFPKDEYKKLSGLRIMSVDPTTYDKLNDINYTYDEDNEIFIIQLDRPGILLAYIDGTIANQTSNPNTGDSINRYFIMFIISTLGLISLGVYSKKKIFN